MKYYIGIDNGVTGGICVVNDIGEVKLYEKTPVKKCLNYTKKKEFLNRLDGVALAEMLKPFADACIVAIERPMLNPSRWKASVSALRCDEATLIVLEMLNIPYRYIDSKEWQSEMLPKRKAPPRTADKKATSVEKAQLRIQKAKFKKETKELSLAVGNKLFPLLTFKDDADPVLIAEWARRTKL